MYNSFINDKEFGVEALNTNKKFAALTYNSSMAVPSDLLGKLYEKNNQMYLAIEDEKKIDDAMSWLKDNNLEAILIKENA